jgi:ATP-binding cassette subfamily B protein
MLTSSFKLIRQLDVMDCGPTCLQMMSLHFGKKFNLNYLRELCDKGQQGVTLLGICRAAEDIGLKTLPIKLSVETFIKKAQLPCLVHWRGDHYVVVYKKK